MDDYSRNSRMLSSFNSVDEVMAWIEALRVIYPRKEIDKLWAQMEESRELPGIRFTDFKLDAIKARHYDGYTLKSKLKRRIKPAVSMSQPEHQRLLDALAAIAEGKPSKSIGPNAVFARLILEGASVEEALESCGG